MKIAIHNRPGSFSDSWIEYCKQKNVSFKIVDAYRSDVVGQLHDCDAFMWHFHHANHKDTLFAKQLLYSLEKSGISVFPDFHTCWHFDDKVGQKYLLEASGFPLVSTYVFYNKNEALNWANNTDFPKVFKLRSGSASSNVKLVLNKKSAKGLIKQAFGNGFQQYEPMSNLKERWRKFKDGKTGYFDLVKGLIRFGYTTEFSKVAGRERGYIYFQDFIEGCDGDFRLKVVGERCWGFKRDIREGDFRASGSGKLDFDKTLVKPDLVKLAFKIADKLKLQACAFDFVLDRQGDAYLLEQSYGFGYEDKQFYGYWDKKLNWHEGAFDPFGWMVEGIITKHTKKCL